MLGTSPILWSIQCNMKQ